MAVMWANGFAENEHDVILASNLNEDITYVTNEKVNKCNIFEKGKRGLIKWSKATLSLRKLMKEERPDVVIGVMGTCSFVSLFASIGLGIPVIATEHNSFERPSSAPMSKKDVFLKFYINKLYRCVTVLTDADRRVIGRRLHNVHVMPNPLALQPTCGIQHKKHTIIAAGRLDDWHYKGFDVLVKAWALIAQQFPDWTVQIAGHGEEKDMERIVSFARQAGVHERIELLGYTTCLDKRFQESEIFVLSSRYEGFGLVLIEAMSQGCACVACDYKGRQSEIIRNSEEGLTCEPDNVDALANNISRLIEDEEYRKRIQKNAIERSKYYSIENTMDRWSSVLETVINKK